MPAPRPDRAVVVPDDDARSAADPRHRRGRRLHGPATAVTAVVVAGAVGLAGYTALASSQAPSSASTRTAFSGIVGVDRAGSTLVSGAVDRLRGAAVRHDTAAGAVRIDRMEAAHTVITLSADTGREAGDLTQERLEEAAAARDAERRAAQEEAERVEAERLAAEQAAAQEAAAQEVAAQEAAAEEAAAQEAAAQEAAAQEVAAQEAAPEPAAVEEPVEEPVEEEPVAPAPAPSGDPRSIARGMLGSYGWGDDQWGCLESLWSRESGWNPSAENPSSGAYGIPQALPASKMATAGSDWATNPATQIEWGLGYISGRYGTPCGAWAHSEAHNWY